MRDFYKLSKLTKYDDDFKIDQKDEIFFKMLDYTKKDFIIIDSIEELSNIMDDGKYFIAHSIIICKGKKRFFKGDSAISSNKFIIEFIKKEIEDKDLRSLLIAPIFEVSPSYVIFIHEDGVFYLYKCE